MSKKLEKNGLWESSRMMLPQHREALLNRQREMPSVAPSRPKREEIELMRDYILLLVLHTLVTRKIREMEASTETLKSLYAKVAQVLAQSIYTDISQIKQEMMEKEMRIANEEKDDSVMHCRYVCRGYEDSFMITKEAMRAEISVRLRRYSDQLVKNLREAGRT